MQRAVSGRDNVFGEPEFADEDDPIELVSPSLVWPCRWLLTCV